MPSPMPHAVPGLCSMAGGVTHARRLSSPVTAGDPEVVGATLCPSAPRHGPVPPHVTRHVQSSSSAHTADSYRYIYVYIYICLLRRPVRRALQCNATHSHVSRAVHFTCGEPTGGQAASHSACCSTREVGR
jgi:hypothetical protein